MSRDIKFRAFIKKLSWVVPIEQINFNVETEELYVIDEKYQLLCKAEDRKDVGYNTQYK